MRYRNNILTYLLFQQTGTRETYEEAGVKGDLGKLLTVSENEKNKTYFYFLLVNNILEKWPEQDIRERIWV